MKRALGFLLVVALVALTAGIGWAKYQATTAVLSLPRERCPK